MCELYDDFFKPWETCYKIVDWLPKAYLFTPMLEYTAMLTSADSFLHRLNDQRQLTGRSGEMLAFVLSNWPWNE
ncbi:unnamed protein product [Aphanomyces euteiches]